MSLYGQHRGVWGFFSPSEVCGVLVSFSDKDETLCLDLKQCVLVFLAKTRVLTWRAHFTSKFMSLYERHRGVFGFFSPSQVCALVSFSDKDENIVSRSEPMCSCVVWWRLVYSLGVHTSPV